VVVVVDLILGLQILDCQEAVEDPWTVKQKEHSLAPNNIQNMKQKLSKLIQDGTMSATVHTIHKQQKMSKTLC
jgi:hypothetical protein